MIDLLHTISGTVLPEYLLWLEPVIAYAFSVSLIIIILNLLFALFKKV